MLLLFSPHPLIIDEEEKQQFSQVGELCDTISSRVGVSDEERLRVWEGEH